MATAPSEVGPRELRVHVREVILPPHHELHGTPHPVRQRVITFELPQGTAEMHQTDYGHPGRFNPCLARRIAAPLESQREALLAAATAVAALLDRPK